MRLLKEWDINSLKLLVFFILIFVMVHPLLPLISSTTPHIIFVYSFCFRCFTSFFHSPRALSIFFPFSFFSVSISFCPSLSLTSTLIFLHSCFLTFVLPSHSFPLTMSLTRSLSLPPTLFLLAGYQNGCYQNHDVRPLWSFFFFNDLGNYEKMQSND